MPFASFHDAFPRMAEAETRSATVLAGNEWELPPDTYSFLELYCNERGCDCRRVYFSVMASRAREIVAVVSWGWEPVEFYMKWGHGYSRAEAAAIKGPLLNRLSPQSEWAPAVKRLLGQVLLQDPDYVERLKRHYRMFRARIGDVRAAGPPAKRDRGKKKRRRRK